jgi:hypothetical protein
MRAPGPHPPPASASRLRPQVRSEPKRLPKKDRKDARQIATIPNPSVGRVTVRPRTLLREDADQPPDEPPSMPPDELPPSAAASSPPLELPELELELELLLAPSSPPASPLLLELLQPPAATRPMETANRTLNFRI